jgi:hypothetical protein
VTDYTEYLSKQKKEEIQYLKELNQLITEEAKASNMQNITVAVAAGPRPPVERRMYDEPLTDILFRDNMSWNRVVISYALVLRWRAKLGIFCQKRDTNRAAARSSSRIERIQLLKSVQNRSKSVKGNKCTTHLGLSTVEFYNAEVKLIRLMQQRYQPNLFETLKKNPDMISEGLAWSPELELIVSRSRHAVTPAERETGFGKDLVHIPLMYTHNGKKYLNRVAQLLIGYVPMKTPDMRQLEAHLQHSECDSGSVRARHWLSGQRRDAHYVKEWMRK